MNDEMTTTEITDTIARLLRIFPTAKCFAAPFRPGEFNARFSYHLGGLDITFDHEKLMGVDRKIIRATVWNNCDALLAVDLSQDNNIDQIQHWQDDKIRKQLLPLVNQKLILDDLAGVEGG